MKRTPRNRMPAKTKNSERVTDNGLKLDDRVQFDLTEDQIKAEYPDHSLTETYRVSRVLLPHEASSKQYEVALLNSQNERVGYARAKHLKQA